MYVVIVGAGRIGVRLARWMLDSGSEVTLVELNRRRSEIVKQSLGEVAIQGDGSSFLVLDEAGLSRADIFVTTTGADDVNLLACQVAKHHYGVKKTISTVYLPEHEDLFKMLGVDMTINISNLAIESLETGMADLFVEEV